MLAPAPSLRAQDARAVKAVTVQLYNKEMLRRRVLACVRLQRRVLACPCSRPFAFSYAKKGCPCVYCECGDQEHYWAWEFAPPFTNGCAAVRSRSCLVWRSRARQLQRHDVRRKGQAPREGQHPRAPAGAAVNAAPTTATPAGGQQNRCQCHSPAIEQLLGSPGSHSRDPT